MNDDDTLVQRALNLSYRYLKFRPRSIHEIKKYLEEKARKKPKKYPFNDAIIHKVIQELEEQELLNDKKFVEWFVRYRAAIKPKGTFVLQAELKRFGVSPDIIANYFARRPVDEDAAAFRVLEKRHERYKRFPKMERRKKMQDFLLRRGFSYEAIKKAIAQLDTREYNRDGR